MKRFIEPKRFSFLDVRDSRLECRVNSELKKQVTDIVHNRKQKGYDCNISDIVTLALIEFVRKNGGAL